jgi:ATP-binding cassette subfamily B protein
LLEGFGIPVSYGRLREACQTDVDGTSINVIEDLAVQLGLDAEQVMIPPDHLVLPEAQALPAMVITQLPNGMTHFLVVWAQFGKYLQVMDPATGRRWPSWQRFVEELFIHSFPVPADAWRGWAGSPGFLAPLQRRMKDLSIVDEVIEALIGEALQDPGWRTLASLDAAVRMTAALVRSRAFERGEQAGRIVRRFYESNLAAQVHQDAQTSAEQAAGVQIPERYWSVLPFQPTAGAPASQDGEQVLLRGCVLVRVGGRRATISAVEEATAPGAQLPPDVQAALSESAVNPARYIWQALKSDGLLTPTILALSLALATLGVLVEAMLFQVILNIGQNLTTVSQRIGAVSVLLGFVLTLLLLEFPISATTLRMGRRLETRLRVAFLEKLPRLGDRYFRSRPASDMAQRAYDLRSLRSLPSVGVSLLRTSFQIILTTLGVIWLDPISAPLAILGTIFFVGLSFLTRPLLDERDLRLRTHIGSLSRFYLDALLGLVPARTHGAERALRRQHESQMIEWARATRNFSNTGISLHSLGTLLYSAFAVLILINYISKGGEPGEVFLLFYWTLSLPALGQSLADLVQNYPMLRNRVLRLLEPLGAPDEEDIWAQPAASPAPVEPVIASQGGAIEVQFEGVSVVAGGHRILEDVNLHLQPGEHIAVVGPSGAGKSSLVGLLLGWHRPAVGSVRIDGVLLDGRLVQELRQVTAWVDPAVQLWNRSLFDNLRYGMEAGEGTPLGGVIQQADLYGVLERLPDGLKTGLGESGGLVSGGEGQRVRLGRAMLRSGVRLVILDEPFRGLDRERRSRLLAQAREHWSNATLICITHDVGETLAFPRVVVIENGRVVEEGSPQSLSEQADGRYRAMLEAEQLVRTGMWQGAGWRKFNMEEGVLKEEGDPAGGAG